MKTVNYRTVVLSVCCAMVLQVGSASGQREIHHADTVAVLQLAAGLAVEELQRSGHLTETEPVSLFLRRSSDGRRVVRVEDLRPGLPSRIRIAEADRKAGCSGELAVQAKCSGPRVAKAIDFTVVGLSSERATVRVMLYSLDESSGGEVKTRYHSLLGNFGRQADGSFRLDPRGWAVGAIDTAPRRSGRREGE